MPKTAMFFAAMLDLLQESTSSGWALPSPTSVNLDALPRLPLPLVPVGPVSIDPSVWNTDVERTVQTKRQHRVSRQRNPGTASTYDGPLNGPDDSTVLVGLDAIGIRLDGVPLSIGHHRVEIKDEVVVARAPHHELNARTARDGDASVLIVDVPVNDSRVHATVRAVHINGPVGSHGDRRPLLNSAEPICRVSSRMKGGDDRARN